MAQTMVVRRAVAVTFALLGIAGAFIAGTGTVATAATGDPVIAGSGNYATQPTAFINAGSGTNASGDGVSGSSNFMSGTSGVDGQGDIGVLGEGRTIGVWGNGLTGVIGHSKGLGDGVDGTADNSCCSAVFGLQDGTGNGVAGRADTGTGVLAASTNGTALSVQGTFVAQRSGLATVATGQIYKQVSLTKLSSATFIVATVQGATAGVWVQRVLVNATGGYFRIYLNKAATASTKVGWFAIN